MTKSALMLMFALVAAPASAQFYRCDIDGRTVFGDRPCAVSSPTVADHRKSQQKAQARLQQDARERSIRPANRQHIAALADGTICARGKGAAESQARDRLANDYPDAFSLQLRLLRANMSAWSDICSALPRMSDTDVRILRRLSADYSPSFSLIKRLLDANASAARQLGR